MSSKKVTRHTKLSLNKKYHSITKNLLINRSMKMPRVRQRAKKINPQKVNRFTYEKHGVKPRETIELSSPEKFKAAQQKSNPSLFQTKTQTQKVTFPAKDSEDYDTHFPAL